PPPPHSRGLTWEFAGICTVRTAAFSH
ncbi:MAG: hypothetical protein QOC75_3414, partial [Pseudonocardiales bacterium]|nr:hypothetical protein [Pseudonocardiales bacterium]